MTNGESYNSCRKEIAETKNIELIEKFLAKLEYSQSLSSIIIANLSGEGRHNRDKPYHLDMLIAGILSKTTYIKGLDEYYLQVGEHALSAMR